MTYMLETAMCTYKVVLTFSYGRCLYSKSKITIFFQK